MSEEPARPEEGVGGEEERPASSPAEIAAEVTEEATAEVNAEATAEATADVAAEQPQDDQPTQQTNVQEPEKAEASIEKMDPTLEETRPMAEQSLGAAQDGTMIQASSTAGGAAFPLLDDNVLAELKAGEARAREAAKTIEALKVQLAETAMKDVMTEEDIQIMKQKQKELMDKIQEFEDVTKKIQQLVGLVDVASSQLGPPEKPLFPGIDIEKTGEPQKEVKGRPMDSLPKVIICGTGDIEEVPKIIICEPTSERNGKHPLYHQVKNGGTGKTTSETKVSDSKGRSDQDQTVRGVLVPPNPWSYPGWQPGQGPMGPVRPFGDGGYNMGIGQGGMMQPGTGQYGMVPPWVEQAGTVQPGTGQYGMVAPGMPPWTTQPGMMHYGTMQPNVAKYGMFQSGVMGQGGLFPPGICDTCGHPRKRHRAKDTKRENTGKTANKEKSTSGESQMKKSCRKKKQCYCEITGLCKLNGPLPLNK